MSSSTTAAPVVSKRAAFFTLLGASLDELPKDVVNQTIVAHRDVPAGRAGLVLQGKTADIGILVKMIRTTLPKFKFPKQVEEYVDAE